MPGSGCLAQATFQSPNQTALVTNGLIVFVEPKTMLTAGGRHAKHVLVIVQNLAQSEHAEQFLLHFFLSWSSDSCFRFVRRSSDRFYVEYPNMVWL